MQPTDVNTTRKVSVTDRFSVAEVGYGANETIATIIHRAVVSRPKDGFMAMYFVLVSWCSLPALSKVNI